MKNSKPYCLLTLLLLIFNPLAFSDQDKISLIVNVSGATPGKGRAILSLFSSSDTFLKQPKSSRTKSIDNNGQVVFSLDQLEPGTYTISIVHDEDSNGKLNTGLFGIPKELVGFSNSATSMLGPPSYKKASFVLSEPD